MCRTSRWTYKCESGDGLIDYTRAWPGSSHANGNFESSLTPRLLELTVLRRSLVVQKTEKRMPVFVWLYSMLRASIVIFLALLALLSFYSFRCV